MPSLLTKRQQQILDFIKQYGRQHGYPPSVREIAKAVGLRSGSTVHGHLTRLQQKGYLFRDPTKPRAINVYDRTVRKHTHVSNPAPTTPTITSIEHDTQMEPITVVPLVGNVTAGLPILAEEHLEATFPLPKAWTGQDAVFMLRIQGESMIEAGIYDGDLVLVRQQSVAENGDIIVALLDDEATVKRFYREATHVRLQPENAAMEPIYTRDVHILGRVVGLYRQYA